jgi:hypothetical protein
MNAPVRDIEDGCTQETGNPLWYLFADAVGEAISNPPVMRPI